MTELTHALVLACLAIFSGSVTHFAKGKGILYPQESESRERKSLDGIWNFRVAPRNDPELGFKQEWFKQPLSEVSPFADY